MKYKDLNRFEAGFFAFASLLLVLFYIYSAVFEPVATQYHRGVYIFFTYTLCFLLYRSKSPWLRIVDYLLIILSAIVVGYWMINFESISYRMGAELPIDKVIATIGVLIGLEISRRVLGIIFPIMGIFFIIYGVYGDYFPEVISHSGENFFELSTSIFYKSDGLFGIMADVLATYVFLFVIFGAFLQKSGAEKFFMDFPLALVGHRTGGPGKVAIIASGFFGSISGSAIANTVSTGTFTIPMMKKAGFKPEVAGAIEPAASVGGMFMPPIMGAGGFIMAELTGIPYSKIMLVSAFPAFLYFFSVYIMVHYYAKANNLKGEKSKISAWSIFKKEWYFTLPLIVITVFMLYGYSPSYAAVMGIFTCFLIGLLGKENRFTPKKLLETASVGFEQSLKIGAIIGVIGIIIGVLSFTGLVLTFADIIIDLANGSLLLTIILIALASLILGMGVPVTAAYLITAVVAVPALTAIGVNELAAHFIVFWLSQDSNLTPPVCIAAFTGATIAKANMWKTAFNALKFAKMLYLAPILFAYLPGFSLQGSTLDIIKTFVFTILLTFVFSYLFSGYWLKYFRRKPSLS